MSNQDLPKKIKRKRIKKFTKNRQPYKTYLQADWIWTDIFKEIDKLKSINLTYLKDTSEKYGINYNTLSKKYNKYCKTNVNKLDGSDGSDESDESDRSDGSGESDG